MNHIGTMFFVGGEPMICMHNCTDCKRKLFESGTQRVHVTSCNIRPSSTLARPLAQIYLCRDPNNTASRNTIALVHRSQLLEFRTGWPLWTCMSIRRCRSVRRNPVTITIAPRGTSTGKPPTPCTRRNDQWGQLVLHPCGDALLVAIRTTRRTGAAVANESISACDEMQGPWRINPFTAVPLGAPQSRHDNDSPSRYLSA